MEFNERKLKGSFEINLNPIGDHRGFFMRTWDEKLFEEQNLVLDWVQENHSRSEQTNTIRGLHLQLPPYAETKLIRCIRGAVLDVIVDLRMGSETFGEWDAIELSESNKKMMLIPKGFAHGFCSITDESEVVYKVDNVYSPENEIGIIWNDPDIGIGWLYDEPILSEKDKKNITIKEFIKEYKGIIV